MAMSRAQRAMIGITGGAAIIGGGARWNSEFNEAQALRGRNENLISDVAQYVGDLPHYINSTLISPEDSDEREPWETPYGNTIPANVVIIAGAGAVAMALRNK